MDGRFPDDSTSLLFPTACDEGPGQHVAAPRPQAASSSSRSSRSSDRRANIINTAAIPLTPEAETTSTQPTPYNPSAGALKCGGAILFEEDEDQHSLMQSWHDRWRFEVPHGSYKRMGQFLGLLSATYLLSLGVLGSRGPDAGAGGAVEPRAGGGNIEGEEHAPIVVHPEKGSLQVLADLRQLIFVGFLISHLSNVHAKDRFEYLFRFSKSRPRGVIFLTFLLGSALQLPKQLVPSLLYRFFELDYWLLLLFASLVLWHVWIAQRAATTTGFLMYLTWKVFFVLLVTLPKTNCVEGIGFLLALFGEYNHPLSVVSLAVGCGMVCSGLAGARGEHLLYS